MKITLAIMAAGIGSRFGGGIKQLEPVGTNGEIIMDYSVHDAIEAGFNKIVFIIRKDIYEDFMEVIGHRIESLCEQLHVEIAYAFQEKEDLPAGCQLPEGREKPWGTGQAVLACRDLIHEPFAVINADDYYGKTAFRQLYHFLTQYTPEKPNDFCMAGFVLKNTLSENGSVTRGVCKATNSGYLEKIEDTTGICKTDTGAAVYEDGVTHSIDADSHVSMNMWGLTPEFMDTLEKEFVNFFEEGGDLSKKEYLLPILIGKLLEQKRVSVKVLETPDTWFGVTYREDKPGVEEAFRKLTQKGVYRIPLFGDLI